jgi:hypothetical protein
MTDRILFFRTKPKPEDSIVDELESLTKEIAGLLQETIDRKKNRRPIEDFRARACDCCGELEKLFVDYETMERDGSKGPTYECCEFCFEAGCSPMAGQKCQRIIPQ